MNVPASNPAKDNCRELIWAVYGAIEALNSRREAKFTKIAKDWQTWLDYIASTAVPIFYRGNGKVCSVTAIADQTLPTNHADQSYKCETATYLDDPYEGELLSYFLHFFGDLSAAEKKKIWKFKRAKLESDEYNMGGVGPITVRKGAV